MPRWCHFLRGAPRRRFVVLALVLAAFLAACAARPDPRLAENPALARVAQRDPAEARRLLAEADRVLRRPPAPTFESAPTMRGPPGVRAVDRALLAENPLLARVFGRDATAALDLLKRVREAGAAGGNH